MADGPAAPRRGAAGFVRDAAVGGAVGVVTGAAGAVAYYVYPLRPVAHTVILWIAAAVAVSFGRAGRAAVGRTTVLLLAAVLAFYVGLSLVYAAKYGHPTFTNAGRVGLWLAFAAAIGPLLGWTNAVAARPGVAGDGAAAALLGLMTGDACIRVLHYRSELPVVGVLALLGCGVLALGIAQHVDDGRQRLVRVGLLAVPATLLGAAVVSLPDVIEQLALR